MKLFQIEEPDGLPTDPDMPGAAIGIDASGQYAEVALSVGGNAAILTDREGFEEVLQVPSIDAGPAAWQALLEGTRIRAERALARPVSHAVIVLAARPDGEIAEQVREAARQAGVIVLQMAARADLAADAMPALAAAMLAEDLMPRPELGAAPGADGDRCQR